jgi:DNA-binding XRE family transcriptional regulator
VAKVGQVPRAREERSIDEVIAGLEARRKKPGVRDRGLPPPEERKRVRRAYGLTQTDMASVLRVHRITVSAWERGAYDPTGRTRQEYLILFRHMKREIGEGHEVSDEEPSGPPR